MDIEQVIDFPLILHKSITRVVQITLLVKVPNTKKHHVLVLDKHLDLINSSS